MEAFRHGYRQVTPEMNGLEILAHSKVYRTEYILNRNAKTYVTVVQVQPDAKASLLIDQRFRDHSIVLDNNLLISQSQTLREWQAKPGKTPAQLLHDQEFFLSSDVIAFAPTNAGWQRKAFWVIDGRPILLHNDQGKLHLVSAVLGKVGDQWRTTTVVMSHGQPEGSQYLEAMEVGFSLPLLVKDGRRVPIDTLLGDPRFQADIRNLFDIGYGQKLPAEFWLAIRPHLPTKPEELLELLHMTPVVALTHQPPESTVELVKHVVLKYKLPYIVTKTSTGINLIGSSSLPYNRIPVMGLGHDRQGRLVVVAADGRLPESSGVTIPELATIMMEWGIVNGGLGSAGGDVGLYTPKFPLSRPANLTGGVSYFRPVPSVLAIR